MYFIPRYNIFIAIKVQVVVFWRAGLGYKSLDQSREEFKSVCQQNGQQLEERTLMKMLE
jgi:hypothetical protein